MLTWKYLPLFVPILLCGCAHGIDRGALQDRLNDGSIQTTDASVAEMRGLKPQLRLPCRVAVYLKPSNSHDWRWTPEDKIVLDQLTAVLKKEGVVADVFMLPEIIAGKGDVKELRVAAAQCGADALFVVHGAAQTDSYQNFASVFNITLVGGYVVPGSHKDTLFLIEGALLDVDNGYIYAAVQAEGTGKIVRPTFTIEERESVSLAKKQAVAQFGDEALKRMRMLTTTVAPQTVPGATTPLIRTAGGVPVTAVKPAPVTPVVPAAGPAQPRYTAEKPASVPVPTLTTPPLTSPPANAQPRSSGLTTILAEHMNRP